MLMMTEAASEIRVRRDMIDLRWLADQSTSVLLQTRGAYPPGRGAPQIGGYVSLARQRTLQPAASSKEAAILGHINLINIEMI
jgi:hypothetical protein